MSLQVWLPLDGNLNNQGLANITLTSGTPSFKQNGKIGQCFDLNTRANFNCPELNGLTTFSVAFWAKVNQDASLSTDWVDIIGFIDQKSDNSATGQLRWETCYGSSYTTRGISYHDNATYAISNLSATSGSDPVSTKGIWEHLAFVVTSSTIYAYRQGILKATYAPNGGHLTGAFWLGQAGVVNGELNDVRIYDHALSTKEVKELSKGLILHYKLDNNGLGNPNLLQNTKAFTPVSGGTSTLTTNEYGGTTIRTYNQTLSSGLKEIVAYNNVLYPELGATYTMSFWAKGSGQLTTYFYGASGYLGVAHVKNSQGYSGTGGDGTNPINLSSTWTRYWVTWTLKDTGDTTIYKHILFRHIYSATNATLQIDLAGVKLEKGAIATAWSPASSDIAAINNNIIYDVSGYDYAATANAISWSSPSPRYSAAAHFNGIDSYIRVPFNEACPDNIFTINLWFKKDTLGSKGYETLFGGPSGFEMDTRAGNATTLSLYMATTRGGNVFSPFNLGEWYMVTMVRDGTNELYYVNGELKKTIEAKAMPTGTYRIGAWSSDTGQNYYGEISDFRVYNTPLIVDDIKELYHTSASIDSNGNIYAKEVIEI